MNQLIQNSSSTILKRFILLAIFLLLVTFIAINVTNENGMNKIMDMAKDFGGESNEDEFPSIEELIKGAYSFSQDDPRLVEIIRKKYLRPPPGLPYNLTNPHIRDPMSNNTRKIRRILKDKKNGFFIECGAFKGEYYSNSIFWERFMGWQGILLEPVPEFYQTLSSKNRNSWSAQICLSPKAHPMEVQFQLNGWGSAIARYSKHYIYDKRSLVTAQCFPLYSILLAVNKTKIDYFILDVEAVEFKVLKTIPWDKVNITTIMVEVQFIQDKKPLVRFMEKQGYRLENNVTDFKAHAMDYIFYHPLLLLS